MADNGKKIIGGVFWRLLERTSSQLVSLVVSIVLARLLLPEDFGIISMVTIFIALADVLVCSGLPAALIQKKDADDTDFSSVFYANLVLSLFLYVVLYIFSPHISAFFEMPLLAAILPVFGLRIIIAGISSVQLAYASRNMLFRHYFWATLSGSVVSGIIGVAAAYLGAGVWALVFQQITSVAISTVVTFIVIPWKPHKLFSFSRLKGLFCYGWRILFEGISEALTVQARNLIIGKVYTSDDLGFYTKAQQFPNLLINNVVSSISSVLFPAMSSVQDNPEQVKALLRKSASLATYIMFPLMFGLALVAKPFVTVILTEKWLECVPYLQIFCFTQGATIGMIVRHEAMKSIGRSDVYMYEHIIYRVVVFALLLAIYKISVLAIALSLIAGSLIMSFTVGITSKIYNSYGFKEQLADVLPTTIACLIMSVPVYLIGLLKVPAIIVLVLQILAGILVFLAASHIFKIEGYIFVKNSVINVLKRRKEE